MTTEELRALADEAFVQVLVQRVLEKLLERQKKALVVFTGSNIGEAAALDAMGRLRKEGFSFKVLLSRAAANLLPVDKITALLEPEELWINVPSSTPEALTKIYDTIIVPTMTVHTASHVAACMADTPASAVILDGLMRGKNVIINIDGCCPDNAERPKRGFRIPEPMRQVLRGHLETLRSFGARLSNSEEIDVKTLKALRFAPAKSVAAPASSKPAVTAASSSVLLKLDGKILGIRSIQGVASHSTVRVPKGTLITQLAADDARRRDIKIVKEA